MRSILNQWKLFNNNLMNRNFNIQIKIMLYPCFNLFLHKKKNFTCFIMYKINKFYIIIVVLTKSLYLFWGPSIFHFKVDKQVHEFLINDLISTIFERLVFWQCFERYVLRLARQVDFHFIFNSKKTISDILPWDFL